MRAETFEITKEYFESLNKNAVSQKFTWNKIKWVYKHSVLLTYKYSLKQYKYPE